MICIYEKTRRIFASLKQKQQMAKSITISTEEVNAYGFRILTSGIDTRRFNANPVLFYNHYTWGMPIGRWSNLSIKDNKVMATPEFDELDEQGKLVKRKFDDGYLSAASIGIRIIETSDDPSVLVQGQTYPTVTKCELIEVSIVAIPANAQATVQLCDEQGQAITNLSIGDVFKKTQTQAQIQLQSQTQILKKQAMDTTEELQKMISQLELANLKLTQEKKEAEALSLSQNAEVLVDAAIGARKITAEQRDAYIRLSIVDYETVKGLLEKTKPYLPISDQIKLGMGNADDTTKTDSQRYDDLDKSNKLAVLKKQQPEEFERLLAAKKLSVRTSGSFSE